MGKLFRRWWPGHDHPYICCVATLVTAAPIAQTRWETRSMSWNFVVPMIVWLGLVGCAHPEVHPLPEHPCDPQGAPQLFYSEPDGWLQSQLGADPLADQLKSFPGPRCTTLSTDGCTVSVVFEVPECSWLWRELPAQSPRSAEQLCAAVTGYEKRNRARCDRLCVLNRKVVAGRHRFLEVWRRLNRHGWDPSPDEFSVDAGFPDGITVTPGVEPGSLVARGRFLAEVPERSMVAHTVDMGCGAKGWGVEWAESQSHWIH